MPTPPPSHEHVLELLRESREELSWLAQRAEARLRQAEGLEWRRSAVEDSLSSPAQSLELPLKQGSPTRLLLEERNSQWSMAFGGVRQVSFRSKDSSPPQERQEEEAGAGPPAQLDLAEPAPAKAGERRSGVSLFKSLSTETLSKARVRFAEDRGAIISGRLEKAVQGREHFAASLVHSRSFDMGVGLLILLNSVFMALQVDYGGDRRYGPELLAGSVIFTLLFLLEFVLRLWGEGCLFWLREPPWNVVDAAVTLCSVAELVLRLLVTGELESTAGNMAIFRTLRMLRFARAARVLRVMHFFRELRLMVISITHSLQSIVWALVLLLMTTFMFGISITQGVKDAEEGELQERLQRHFGSVGRTMLTLFQAVLGGFSWAELTDRLRDVGWVYEFLFCGFVAFTVLALLNVVTGVFVDGALQSAAQDRDIAIQDQEFQEGSCAQELRRLFKEADEDGSGSLSLEEFLQYLADDRVQSYLRALGINPAEAENLFHLLDLDDSGSVETEEFIAGCLRWKGEAKGIDVFTLMMENKRLVLAVMSALEAVAQDVTAVRTSQRQPSWQSLRSKLGRCRAMRSASPTRSRRSSFQSVPSARPSVLSLKSLRSAH